MGVLLLPRLGSEVAEADVAGMEPRSLHPAVLSTRGGKQAGLPEVAWHPCEPAVAWELEWAGRHRSPPVLPAAEPGAKPESGYFYSKQSTVPPHRPPPGKPLVSTESQETDKVPSLKELLASPEAQPGLQATALRSSFISMAALACVRVAFWKQKEERPIKGA